MALLVLQHCDSRETALDGSLRRIRVARCWLAFGLMLALIFPGAGILNSQDASEHRLKAVFLYNFTQFVTWPEKAFASRNSPLIIGILGRDPFGPILDATVKGESINGRPLQVRRFQSVNEIKECHILFISSSEKARMIQIIDALGARPILTVGETEGFALNGGMIRFLFEGNKLRFRINTQATEKAGLDISSKLLRLAEIVKTERSLP